MAIPLATTTIAVLRVPTDPTRDGYDEAPAPDVVASGVPAHFSAPSGKERVAGSSQASMEWSLLCDYPDLAHNDRVRDETTGDEWEVTWAQFRQGLGLDHTKAGVRRVEGLV